MLSLWKLVLKKQYLKVRSGFYVQCQTCCKLNGSRQKVTLDWYCTDRCTNPNWGRGEGGGVGGGGQMWDKQPAWDFFQTGSSQHAHVDTPLRMAALGLVPWPQMNTLCRATFSGLLGMIEKCSWLSVLFWGVFIKKCKCSHMLSVARSTALTSVCLRDHDHPDIQIQFPVHQDVQLTSSP